jgi:hypothetical protein
MALRLLPFPADSAGMVSGWARTREEVIMWCGLPAASVTAGPLERATGIEPAPAAWKAGNKPWPAAPFGGRDQEV